MELLDCSGVGEATVKMLEKYGVNTPEKILTIFPKAYKDTEMLHL